ncbi:MAG: DUF2513 domain-containing protein [Steroidobacteraceae bacterium]
MDLIRELLLRLDAMPIGIGEAYFLEANKPPLCLAGDDPNKVYYNMGLIADAGFLALTPSQPAIGFGLTGLTWRGHEFLDTIRDPEIWRKTKDAASKAGGFTVSLLADLAKGLVKTQIEKHTGVKL